MSSLLGAGEVEAAYFLAAVLAVVWLAFVVRLFMRVCKLLKKAADYS
ncbi:MAG: hypothetical protein U0996_24455 [Planctomycetaceae bacterium]